MLTPTEDRATRLLKKAEELYYRLVLIAGEPGSGKTSLIYNVAKLYGSEPINLNLCLSQKLLEFTEKQRQLKLPEILAQVVDGNGDKLFLDNIELLFDPMLKQDSLRLLKALSRRYTVLASWNGTFKKDKLTYAEPGHREYRIYKLTDTLVVSMTSEATVDFKQSSEDKLI